MPENISEKYWRFFEKGGREGKRIMLKYIKKQINELLDTLAEAKQAVEAVILQEDEEELMSILADAQDAAVAIGNKIESSEGTEESETSISEEDGSSAVKLIGFLELYCELLWKLIQSKETEERLAILAEAWGILDSVRQGIRELPDQMVIVFMPYKASMWDCMESVWQAACEDPDWVPFVVPIPYMDLKDGEVTASHYEGGDFPPEVPITIYSEFPLEQIHPEAIYIHNPFDDNNIVTSVLPQYYSTELKKNTDRLIYCPYYVTGEAVFVTHRYIPSYDNMDFIVTQCEKMIASYSEQIPRKKFLPFGSPIADRILRMEKEKPAIPEAWKKQLKNGRDFGGDRVVMLNTSISLFMKQRERFLDKIEYLIRLAKQIKGITLVWRPHPLLHATAQTMGETYAARLAELENKFLEEKIGVLDQTRDVGVTVALCDAYLGETASSMIHMFGIAGKPRFYINLQMPDNEKAAEDTFLVSGFCQTEETEYYVLDQPGWIAERNKSAGQVKLLVRIPGREFVRGRAYRGMELKGDSLWLYPEHAKGIFIYQIGTGRMRKVFEHKMLEIMESAAAGSGHTHGKIEHNKLMTKKNGETESGNGQGGFANGIAETDMESAKTEIFLTVGEECLAAMRAEKFQRGNLNHEWYENEKSSAEDFFHFLQTAKEEELTGYQGAYPVWLATLDGSCGRKILHAVKASLTGRK